MLLIWVAETPNQRPLSHVGNLWYVDMPTTTYHLQLLVTEEAIGKWSQSITSYLIGVVVHRCVEYLLDFTTIIIYRCICDEGHRCVLTNNLSDRKAYVFKCRSLKQSENMFPFPDNPSIALWLEDRNYNLFVHLNVISSLIF